MPKYKIQNIVASADLGTELDLTQLVVEMENAEYEPESFPGLVFRLKKPKTATLIFRSGKIVCTGSKSIGDVKQAIQMVTESLKDAGIPLTGSPAYEVQNIVASADLEQPINLTSTVISLGLEKVEYEPEVFPGLVYRLDDPKVVILLFGSGRLVCTGAKKPMDVEAAIVRISRELRSVGLLSPEPPGMSEKDRLA
ncbi:TATA-box-binding protein [Methanomassiliicoccus luminyensis]|uniref:TATA-box-binding protein n=1 Tax=Methanomassiliicoccus luminyensis TaxID=1080712 RepID=UPI000674FC3A